MHTSLIDAITLNRQNVEIYTRAYHPCRLFPHRKEDDAFQTPHKLCVPAGSVRSPPEACVLLIQRVCCLRSLHRVNQKFWDSLFPCGFEHACVARLAEGSSWVMVQSTCLSAAVSIDGVLGQIQFSMQIKYIHVTFCLFFPLFTHSCYDLILWHLFGWLVVVLLFVLVLGVGFLCCCCGR